MKATLFWIFTVLAFGTELTNAQSRTVTLMIDSVNRTGSVTVGTNESVEFKTLVDPMSGGYAMVEIETKGKVLTTSPPNPFSRGFPLVGPATVSIKWHPDSGPGTAAWFAWMTVELKPDSFPPDKTLIIPENTSAVVSLECSTNLITWTNVWSGAYSNAPTHKFFRLNAQRTQ